jgi:cell division FtsZ-interacting protein ZapD
MPDQSINTFIQHLHKLQEFKKQGEQLNVEEFENWKSNLLKELDGNYKIKTARLVYYTISEERQYDSDDLPF